MILNYNGLREREAWEKAGVKLPEHDWKAMCVETEERPVWVHFGAGNIFRIFVAGLQQRLLDAGEAKAGIVAVETFDSEVIEKIYVPHDSMTLAVSLLADGGIDKSVVASVAKGVVAAQPEGLAALREIFRKPSLQMLSFTITEKGYALRDMNGALTPVAAADIENGPAAPKHAMGVVAALLLERFNAGGTPIAVVSMDNCSHNGEKLCAAISAFAKAWQDEGFIDYISDPKKVSFPWSMIDKITPRPDASVEAMLRADGLQGLDPVITSKNTYIAPFVNAEESEYLVIEDDFPNGRPALEKAGFIFTDRETVNKVERMKVCTCLNPLHTSLAVYGCLLGYTRIWQEMKDEDLVKLIRRVGYVEGLPVVTDPGVINPREFIDTVVNVRLPNPFMPDAPQRIATDTSQKIPIRFGETILLVLAGWIRYLMAVDDEGKPFELSSDPLLDTLRPMLADIHLGDRLSPAALKEKLSGLLSNAAIFGVDLIETGLADEVCENLSRLISGKGAVRKALQAL